MSREDASEKIHDLADKIAEGEINLKSGDNSVKLNPAEQVEFEIEVEEEEDGDISIEIEVEWSKTVKDENLEIN